MSTCDICYELYDTEQLQNHLLTCMEQQIKKMKQIDDKHNADKLILTDTQQKALHYANKKAKIYTKNMHLLVLARLQMNNYTENDLNAVISYMQTKMPIIIHVRLDNDKIKIIYNDTHYRNTFEIFKNKPIETNPRVQWENTLFGKIYGLVDGVERVKYGALNLTNDPNGLKSCLGYGDSYFVLKNKVKERISFVQGDSCGQQLHIATFKHFEHILYYYSDKLLDDIIKVATGKSSHTIDSEPLYTELQVHGPVRLDTDIEKVVINRRHKKDQNIIKILKERNIPYQWM